MLRATKAYLMYLAQDSAGSWKSQCLACHFHLFSCIFFQKHFLHTYNIHEWLKTFFELTVTFLRPFRIGEGIPHVDGATQMDVPADTSKGQNTDPWMLFEC